MDKVCKICGSQDYRHYLKFKDKGREIVACSDCKTFRTMPYFEMDYRDQKLYCEHYIKNEDNFRDFAKVLLEAVKRHRQKGRLLDIGCAVGFLMEEAMREGFEAEGIELNEKAVNIASSKGLNVKKCTLQRSGYEKNIFDVVILNHVLEHIIEPNRFMQDLRTILKDTGILVIGVPNHGSLVAGLFRRQWYGWGIPEHIWHFDRESFANLLYNNSFKVKEMVQNSQYYLFSKSFRKNSIGVVAKIGNALGLGDQLIAVVEKA